MWRSIPFRRLVHTGFLVSILLGSFLPGCRDRRTGDHSRNLFLATFHEDQRTDLHRDHVLVFEFSMALDPASVGLDTLQVTTESDAGPVLGLYEVQGNIVRFNPVVDEEDPNRGILPLNPYGFEANTKFRVLIPAASASQTKVLKSAWGLPIGQDFTGGFTTGADFTPCPGDPAPLLAPFDAAVYDTTHAPYSPGNPKGTLEDHDDVLSYTPVPGLSPPPTHPVTSQPDFRAMHPTHVQVNLTFTSVMDPRSIRTQAGGNLVLHFNITGTEDWTFIPTVASISPNGKTVILTAATPLAHASRYNRYRIVLDQTVTSLVSRGGKMLEEAVEKWDDVQKRRVRRDVVEADLTLWTRMEAGERGPMLTASFPLEAFAYDGNESDADVMLSNGKLMAGRVETRSSEDRTPCTLPGNSCSLSLREPLTQDPSSPNPNPNSKGPSKIQFHFNSYQHASTPPGYKLPNAEALVDMSWGPKCNTVIKATYPNMHIHVMWSDRNSSQSTAPVGLPSLTYNSNFDRHPPGFPVRDGKQPYQIPESSASSSWFPWKFQHPFTDYRVDRGLVFMAWTEVGGDVEQYLKWYSPTNTPNTRIFNPPSASVNPAVGQAGQYCYYWTRFEFKRMRSVAVTKFYRMAPKGDDWPLWNVAVVTPSPGCLPGGTHYHMEYRGGKFVSYTRRQAGSREYWEGQGSPYESTPFSSNLRDLNGFPAVSVRVVFEANVDQPASLPFVDGVSFTYELP